jgi:hypothetical protein
LTTLLTLLKRFQIEHLTEVAALATPDGIWFGGANTNLCGDTS